MSTSVPQLTYCTYTCICTYEDSHTREKGGGRENVCSNDVSFSVDEPGHVQLRCEMQQSPLDQVRHNSISVLCPSCEHFPTFCKNGIRLPGNSCSETSESESLGAKTSLILAPEFQGQMLRFRPDTFVKRAV